MNYTLLIGYLGLTLTAHASDQPAALAQEEADPEKSPEWVAFFERQKNTGPVICDIFTGDEIKWVVAPSEYWCHTHNGMHHQPGEIIKSMDLSADGKKVIVEIWTCDAPTENLKLSCRFARKDETDASDD